MNERILPLHKGGFSLTPLYHKSAEKTISLPKFMCHGPSRTPVPTNCDLPYEKERNAVGFLLSKKYLGTTVLFPSHTVLHIPDKKLCAADEISREEDKEIEKRHEYGDPSHPAREDERVNKVSGVEPSDPFYLYGENEEKQYFVVGIQHSEGKEQGEIEKFRGGAARDKA